MRRLAIVVLCLALACVASAQISTSMDSAFRTFHYYGLFPGPSSKSSNPLDQSGFDGRLPEQTPMSGSIPAQGNDLRWSAEAVSGKSPNIHLEGKIVAEYKGYRMEGDVLDGNRDTQIFIVSGNAVLTGPDAIVQARRILVDYRNRTYEAYSDDSQIRPTLVGGILQTDVYAKSQHSNGTEKEDFLHQAEITTCNYPEPHYTLNARDIDLRFNKRLIFRDLSVWILGHHLFNLPFLSIPLDNRRYENLPVVGQDSYEGYYIKTNYGIPLKGDRALYTRLDYMTKLGIGAGINYTVAHNSPSGNYKSNLTLYGVTGIQMLDIQQTHDQTFKWGTLHVQNSYNGHDYLTAPTNDILNSQATISLINRHGQTSLSASRNSNTAPGFDSLQQTYSLANSETLGTSFRETTQVTYTDSKNSYASGTTQTTSDSKIINLNFDATEDLRKAQATLDYVRSIPVGNGGQSFLSSTNRTPNLGIQTDTARLLGQRAGQAFPIKFDAEIGQFGNPQSGADITRDKVELDFAKSADPVKRWHFDTSGQFVQSMYSDNTAEFIVGTSDALSYKLGRDTAFNFRYNYLKSEGFTPLGIDQVGASNLVSEDLSFRVIPSLLAGVQSSYDFTQSEQEQTGFSPVGLRLEFTAKDYLLARVLATYDPFFKGVANYRLDTTYTPGATTIGLGARYDNTRSTWAELDLYVSSLKMGRLKADLRVSYNGYSNQFNSIQAGFVYDLHCAEAVFQVIDNPVGFNSGVSYLFFIRLKGVPFDTSFGAGTRGQPIGYGSGVGY